MCIRDPLRGNQHREASKCCHLHQNGNYKTASEMGKIDFKRLTRSKVQEIPEIVTSGQGCKEENTSNVFS